MPENYTPNPAYMPMAAILFREIIHSPQWKKTDKRVVVIAGESGSGKSTAAVSLQHVFADNGIGATILHMDDYFFLPPKANHQKRVQNLEWVGPQEVNLALLQTHLEAFKSGVDSIQKPVSRAETDSFDSAVLTYTGIQVLIVEGTYALRLEGGDYYIKMERNYLETKEQRLARGRDPIDAFTDQVLAIEHAIVGPVPANVHALVQKDYSIKVLRTPG